MKDCLDMKHMPLELQKWMCFMCFMHVAGAHNVKCVYYKEDTTVESWCCSMRESMLSLGVVKTKKKTMNAD